MSKLDNNSKMIVSKYLMGKNFTDFINTFNLYNYYFTTFNYIIIDNYISNITIKKIIKTLQLFPNLNEIVLNFIFIVNHLYLFHIIKYYNKFKQYLQNVKQIKFRIVDENYKAYNEIYVKYDNLSFYMEFFKNVFEPNVKQKVYLTFNYSNIDVVYNYLNLRSNFEIYTELINELRNENKELKQQVKDLKNENVDLYSNLI